MKVLVVGAGGRVGQAVVSLLSMGGYFVYAGARNPKLIEATETVEPLEFDLHRDTEALTNSLPEVDAIIFTAGSRGKDLLQTDLYGSVKLMKAAQKKGVKRFVHLSTLFALEAEVWEKTMPENMMNYYIAKYFSDLWLAKDSNLDFTILQPGSLEETPGSGKVNLNTKEFGANSIENVAAVLVGVLEQPNTIGKIITMSDGDTPVAEAIADY